MPRQYCQRCAAEVPVDDGVCFFGHEVDADAAVGAPTAPTDGSDAADPAPVGSREDGSEPDVEEDLFAARPEEPDEAGTPEPTARTDPGPVDDATDEHEPHVITPGGEPAAITPDDAGPTPVTPDTAAGDTGGDHEIVTPEAEGPADSADLDFEVVGPADDGASEPAAGEGPDGTADEGDGDGVDVSALEAAIAELESREIEEGDEPVAEPTGEVALDDVGRHEPTGEEPVAGTDESPETAAPTDEPEIDDLIADGDFESDLTWEGEVETEPEDEAAPAAVDADGADQTSWAAEEDEADVFADWDLDDWDDESEETAPPGTAATAAAVDEHATSEDLPADDGEGRTGEDEEAVGAPPSDRADDAAAAPADAGGADDAGDEPGPAIDPTSFTARDRERKGLLSRLFG